MNCLTTLRDLLAYASVAREIEVETERLGRLPEKRASVERRAEKLATRASDAEERLVQARRSLAANEMATKEREMALARYRKQIESVASERELATMTGQIERLQGELDALVEEGLALLEAEEAAAAEIQSTAEELKQAKAEGDAELARLAAQEATHREALELAGRELENRRASLSEDIAALWLPLAEKYGPKAIVPMTPEGSCEGCDMSLLPHERDHVLSALELAHCSRCGRILYDRERLEANS